MHTSAGTGRRDGHDDYAAARRAVRRCRPVALLAAGLALSSVFFSGGCAATKEERQADRAVADYFVGDFSGARRTLQPLAQKTDENYVLNNVRLGYVDLITYHLDDAESAFLRAYEVVNSTDVNDPNRAAAAAIVNEKIKIWKGEPFERAMLNFYLGVVYYMQHDYENARAAFENALFKLQDYEGDKADQRRVVDSDFALGYLMLAKSWQRLGRNDLAKKDFDRVSELKPYLSALADPDLNARSNLLLLVDLGQGPQKARNADGAFVGFIPTPREVGPIPPPQVFIDGQPVDTHGLARPPLDLLALAQQRQWQDIDTIRAFKSVAGTGLIAGGSYELLRNQSRADSIAGLAMLGAGALLKASSQADVRQWEMLPRTVFVIPLTAEPGRHDVTVEFPSGLRQSWRGLEVPAEGEATYYIHIRRDNPGPFNWPPRSMAPPQVTANQ